jgi:cell division protein FtsB
VDVLPAVAVLLGALGSILAVYATLRGQKGTVTQDKLALAWEMQEKQLDMLVAENTDLKRRITLCDENLVTVNRELFACKEGRRQLEVQVEVLKMRLQNG